MRKIYIINDLNKKLVGINDDVKIAKERNMKMKKIKNVIDMNGIKI